MAKVNTNPLSGTRDFGPTEMRQRQYLFSTLRSVFELFGYAPIETPSMERLDILTGKYGEEGDKLIFKVLNQGPYLEKVAPDLLKPGQETALTPELCERALRYDLTVPFARFVVNHRNELILPFRRYQMQPVWRGDRPQKGRYREFWQCDVDQVGTDSLLAEAEFVQIYHLAFSKLGIRGVEIRLNHRSLLQALAELLGSPDSYRSICTVIDKLDKIGPARVTEELAAMQLPAFSPATIQPLFEQVTDAFTSLAKLEAWLGATSSGPRGLQELRTVLEAVQDLAPEALVQVRIDPTLARGLDYYTGTIFEATVPDSGIGSIGGGGRYDDLTGLFGWSGLTGVGISFGADRIYDILEAQQLFPETVALGTRVLLINFGGPAERTSRRVLSQLRAAGIPAELFPEPSKKIAKQFAYADKKGIPFVLSIGEVEVESGLYPLKTLATGAQAELSLEKIIHELSN
jgi:histidyl-tRNA synthetase